MSQSLVAFLGPERVGVLSSAGGAVRFTYDTEYLQATRAQPLSTCLPLQPGPQAQRATLAFFGGLLPEERPRQRAAALLGLSEGNVIGLLDALGGDCAGAITLLPEGTPFPAIDDQDHPPAELSPSELDRRLRRVTTDPFAASASENSACRSRERRPSSRSSGTSIPDAPRSLARHALTTRILKPESDRFPGLVANEFFCMRLAGQPACRLPRSSEPRRLRL